MAQKTASTYRFRVSDALQVPLRGLLLRLKLLEGSPGIDAFKAGSTLRLQGPGGQSKTVSVKSFSVTGGAAGSDLERNNKLDVIVVDGGEPAVGIGWFVVGG